MVSKAPWLDLKNKTRGLWTFLEHNKGFPVTSSPKNDVLCMHWLQFARQRVDIRFTPGQLAPGHFVPGKSGAKIS